MRGRAGVFADGSAGSGDEAFANYLHNVAAMDAFCNFSPEELRWQDYQVRRPPSLALSAWHPLAECAKARVLHCTSPAEVEHAAQAGCVR